MSSMWVRDFRPPSGALALFQVYESSPPLLDFQGYTWRFQCDEPLTLSAYLVPGDPEGSELQIRGRSPSKISSPVFQVQAQVAGFAIDLSQIEEWISLGTVAWLRQLGSIDIAGPLRYNLFTAMAQLDRGRYPLVFETLSLLPIIPLGNAEWLKLGDLQRFKTVYMGSRETTTGWKEGSPVLRGIGQYSALTGFLRSDLNIIPWVEEPTPVSEIWLPPVEKRIPRDN